MNALVFALILSATQYNPGEPVALWPQARMIRSGSDEVIIGFADDQPRLRIKVDDDNWRRVLVGESIVNFCDVTWIDPPTPKPSPTRRPTIRPLWYRTEPIDTPACATREEWVTLMTEPPMRVRAIVNPCQTPALERKRPVKIYDDDHYRIIGE